jgi:hypothetical protein
MKKMFLVALLLGAIFTSCKKTTCDVPATPVDLSGTIFKGTYTTNGTSTLKITFNVDGTMILLFGTTTNYQGNWNKSPNSNLVNFFFADAALNKWKGSGTLNTENNKIAGTLNTITGPTISGTFSLDKE